MTFLPRPAIVAALSAIRMTHTDRCFGRLARGEGIAFTLHRVRPERVENFQPNLSLEISPTFLTILLEETRAAGFDFVTIDDAVARLCARRPAKRPFAVLTFDDGYRDNIEFAAPILKAEGVPWTVFAVPDFLDGSGRLWWLEIEHALMRLDKVDVDGKTVNCRTMRAKSGAFERLRRSCFGLGEAERTALCDRLAKAAGLEPRRLVRDNCLSWDEMASACRAYDLTLGSHTESHAILSCCSHDEARRQIASSRRRLEQRLCQRVVHLAYPHGATSAKAVREDPLAREAGYAAAWTTRPGHLSHRASRQAPYALPRITVNGLFADRTMLRTVLSGIPFICGAGF